MKNLFKKTALISAILLIIAAIFLGGCGNKVNATQTPTESPTPKSTEQSEDSSPSIETEKPTPAVSETEKLPTVEEIEFDPSLLENAEQIASKYNEFLSAWMNSGATKQSAEDAHSQNGIDEMKEFVNNLAAEYDDAYMKAMFVDGWESNPRTVKWFDFYKSNHQTVLLLFCKTQNPAMNDKEPYKRWYVNENIISYQNVWNSGRKETQYILQITHQVKDNSDKNRGLELMNGESAETTYTESIVFTLVDNKVKIVSARFIQ